MAANPRIEQARLRAAGAKRTVAVFSLAGFVAAFAVARASHPGHSAQPASSSSSSSSRTHHVRANRSHNDDGENFTFGSASIAPAAPAPTQAPSVQTSTS